MKGCDVMIKIVEQDVWTNNDSCFQFGLPFKDIGSGEYVLDCNTLSDADLETFHQMAHILEGKMLCKKEDNTLFGIIFWNGYMFIAPTKIIVDEDKMELYESNLL